MLVSEEKAKFIDSACGGWEIDEGIPALHVYLMGAAPAGTGKPYTIFVSDVEGSTELWESNSEVYECRTYPRIMVMACAHRF